MSHFTGWQLIRLLHVFESVATQWVFTTVSLANLFCGCFCWALAPFAVCFAVLWLVRRKSGWGICVLPFVFGGLCLVFMICHAACDHLCPCRSFLNNSFFSCKDRALERDRPYQREKKSLFPVLQKALFCANFAVAPGLICLVCAILLPVTV